MVFGTLTPGRLPSMVANSTFCLGSPAVIAVTNGIARRAEPSRRPERMHKGMAAPVE
jgi:hypothetical protein